jgi:hypothetical protein
MGTRLCIETASLVMFADQAKYLIEQSINHSFYHSSNILFVYYIALVVTVIVSPLVKLSPFNVLLVHHQIRSYLFGDLFLTLIR